MKNFILIILILLSTVMLTASEISFNKVNDFAFAQTYNTPECIKVRDEYLYATTTHGLEIFEIDDNNDLEKISMVIAPCPYRFLIKEDYIYLHNYQRDNYGFANYKLYQIDISDPYNPAIVNTLDFGNDKRISNMNIFDDKLNFQLVKNGNIVENNIYSLPDLEIVGELPLDLQPVKVNDNLALAFNIEVGQTGYYSIYNTSDLCNPIFLGDIDLSQMVLHTKTLNDSIAIISDQEQVTFWNISDPANWEIVSSYQSSHILHWYKNLSLMDNYLMLLNFSGFEIINIENLNNIELVDDIIAYDSVVALCQNSNNIFLASAEEGIQKYSFSNSSIEHIENFFDYSSFSSYSYSYQDYIFVQSDRHGVHLFDVSEPLQSIEIETTLLADKYKVMQGKNNLIWVMDFTDYSYKIFDISNPEAPSLRNTIPVGDLHQISWSYFRFDGSNTDEVYLYFMDPIRIEKYDISEPGEPQLLFDYSLPTQGKAFFVKNGFGYISEVVSGTNNLIILEGLEENEPYISTTLENFSPPNEDFYMQLIGDTFFTRNKPVKAYELSNPLNPEFLYQLQYNTMNSLSSHNEYLFGKQANYIPIYNISNVQNTIVPAEMILELISPSYDCNFIEINGQKYMFVVEVSAIEVFEMNDASIVEDIVVENNSISLSNYPNPFNPATTIFFNLTQDSQVDLSVYNIKGQLVKKLKTEYLPAGQHSVEWNGTNRNNKSVSSGIYFYKIKTEHKTVTKKMLLLE
ncbi:MAG: T9SS type A sorting domain-containing protein [Candidatus Cloacimonadota bacterium]|nr:T9SS type A sorting domain-containing protein [Candidatus Cloacimonadota bacterium]